MPLISTQRPFRAISNRKLFKVGLLVLSTQNKAQWQTLESSKNHMILEIVRLSVEYWTYRLNFAPIRKNELTQKRNERDLDLRLNSVKDYCSL